MSKKIIIFSVVAAICGFCAAEAAKGQRGPRGRKFVSGFGGVYREGDLLVRFAPKANGNQRSAAEKAQVLNALGGGIEKRRYKLVPGLSLVELAPGRKVENALRAFNNRTEILYAGPNYKLEAMSTEPNDPYWTSGDLSGLENIDANDAWDIATDAEDVIVAVIDTGIFYEHEDLNDNMWVNEAEYNGDPNEDDDNNGYEDDINGWNFYDNDSNCIDDYYEDYNSLNFWNGHGTLVASVIGAEGNNGTGVVGVCWNTQIMNLRIFENLIGGDPFDSNAVLSSGIEAIQYAVDNGAKVLNNSWGFYVDTEWTPRDFNDWIASIREAVEYSEAAGTLFIASAGNCGWDNDVNAIYPQNLDCNNIIVVTSTGGTDSIGYNTVDLGAPGGALVCNPLYNKYHYAIGTSISAPFVAGAAALVWSVNPDLTYLEVKDILLDTVDEVESLEGKCVTEGRLNLYKALHRASLYPGSGGFCIKNDSGEPVARFTDSGDLFLAGTLTEDTTPQATANDEFRVQDSDGNDVAIIDMTDGNMYLAGSVQATWVNPSEGSDDFIIRTTSDPNGVAYIDDSGDLYLIGSVYGLEP